MLDQTYFRRLTFRHLKQMVHILCAPDHLGRFTERQLDCLYYLKWEWSDISKRKLNHLSAHDVSLAMFAFFGSISVNKAHAQLREAAMARRIARDPYRAALNRYDGA